MKKGEEGFTLIEILVALSIFTTVLSFVGLTFVFVSGQASRWRQKTERTNQIHLTNEWLYRKVKESNSVLISDTTYTFLSHTDTLATLNVAEGSLFLNGSIPLAPALDSVFVTPCEPDTDIRAVCLIVTYNEQDRHWKYRIMSAKRKPEYWSPLN